MDVTIRRLENNLTTLGAGVILFGFWSFIKSALTYILLGDQSWNNVSDEIRTAVIISSWILVALIALMYLWLGLSARAEGNGKRKGNFYLVVIGLIIFFSSLLILVNVISLIFLRDEFDVILITLIIDVTKVVFLIQILYSAIKLRKLRKQKQDATDTEGVTA